MVGYVLAGHCAFFGLLLSLLAVAAYQNLNDVDRVTSREARFVRSNSSGGNGLSRTLFRGETLPLIREYTRYVVEDAWPQQRRGIVASGGTERMMQFQYETVRVRTK